MYEGRDGLSRKGGFGSGGIDSFPDFDIGSAVEHGTKKRFDLVVVDSVASDG